MVGKQLVMVVEDNGALVDHVSSVLQKTLKYQVINAYSGQQALQLVHLNKSLWGLRRNRIQAIVCDIKMEGMDGLEFLARLRQEEPKNKRIPFILFSAYEDERIWRKAIDPEKGAVCAYLKKPFKREDLLDCLDRIMAGEVSEMVKATVKMFEERFMRPGM